MYKMRKAVLVFGELRKKSRFVQTKRTKLLVVFDCMYCCCICVCLYLVLSKFAEKLGQVCASVQHKVWWSRLADWHIAPRGRTDNLQISNQLEEIKCWLSQPRWSWEGWSGCPTKSKLGNPTQSRLGNPTKSRLGNPTSWFGCMSRCHLGQSPIGPPNLRRHLVSASRYLYQECAGRSILQQCRAKVKIRGAGQKFNKSAFVCIKCLMVFW